MTKGEAEKLDNLANEWIKCIDPEYARTDERKWHARDAMVTCAKELQLLVSRLKSSGNPDPCLKKEEI